MNWLEISSPRLKQQHQAWVRLRGNALTPGIAAYKKFMQLVPSDLSASLVIQDENKPPVWGHVGPGLADLLPQCQTGTLMDARGPASWQIPILLPLLKVASSRQPDCQRGMFGQTSMKFERLLLPFGENLRVRVVQIIYEIQAPTPRNANETR